MEREAERAKLIGLIVNAKKTDPEVGSFTEWLADFLLGYGVIVPDENCNADRLRELVEADRSGRCVVLPVPMHRTLLDTSDPIRPELLKNFRISATWDHCGIVFHSPWNIFLENIEKGHIRLLNEAAEAALKGELDG